MENMFIQRMENKSRTAFKPLKAACGCYHGPPEALVWRNTVEHFNSATSVPSSLTIQSDFDVKCMPLRTADGGGGGGRGTADNV